MAFDGVHMRWKFSARLTSLIVLAVISLAVGGTALGLALARDGSSGDSRMVAAHMNEAAYAGKSKTDSEAHPRAGDRRHSVRHEHAWRKQDADRYKQGKDRRDRFYQWWGPKRVFVVPRAEGFPRSFFHRDSPFVRRIERSQPERQVARPGGMVIALGEVTAVRDGVIEMFTVLGNQVTIDITQLGEDIEPERGVEAIVIAERDGEGYVAQSMNLLDVRLSEMLDGMRARSRSGS